MRKRKRKPYSLAQVANMAVEQKGRCAICHMPLEAGDLHVDHTIPVAAGGSNAARNLRLVHSHCNLSRGARI